MEDHALEQEKIDSLLKWGIVFSIIWLAGFGSLISFRNGYKAKRMIENNQGLVGKGRVWWCFIIGGFGFILWMPIVIIGVINNLS